MSQRTVLLESIAKITADYRAGELAAPTPEHIDTWVNQFDRAVQEPILQELNHVFKKTYFSRKKVEEFLISLLNAEKLVGDDPCAFWKTVNFLNIQGGGKSQIEMLHIFDGLLQAQSGYGIDECGENSSIFVYLDDFIFSGNRLRHDFENWVGSVAPQNAVVHIITIGLYKYGKNYANQKILMTIKKLQKNIVITYWNILPLEDGFSNTNASDVLCPTQIPNEPLIQQYVQGLRFAPKLRQAGNLGSNAIFSSDAGRHVLEQEFLKAGVKIREMCPDLNKYQRPLGNMVLESLGFGSLIVTFRNCPNNAPLALWAGDPWYPLFPRKTN